jgi:hypothetical protein
VQANAERAGTLRREHVPHAVAHDRGRLDGHAKSLQQPGRDRDRVWRT